MLRRGLLQFLPLDDTRRVEASVYLAFVARAVVAPALAEVHHTLLTRMRGQCAKAFRLARDSGGAAEDLDSSAAAVSTAAMVDGLMMHMLTDPDGITAEDAVAALDDHLRRYLRPTRHR